MFTLGRQREKEHSYQYLKSKDEAWRIDAVIDAVHDLLDGDKSAEAVAPASKARWFVLTCVGHAEGDVTLDA